MKHVSYTGLNISETISGVKYLFKIFKASLNYISEAAARLNIFTTYWLLATSTLILPAFEIMQLSQYLQTTLCFRLFLTLSFLAQCSSLVFSLARIAFAWSLEHHLAIARSYHFVKRASDPLLDFSKMAFFSGTQNVPRYGSGLMPRIVVVSFASSTSKS